MYFGALHIVITYNDEYPVMYTARTSTLLYFLLLYDDHPPSINIAAYARFLSIRLSRRVSGAVGLDRNHLPLPLYHKTSDGASKSTPRGWFRLRYGVTGLVPSGVIASISPL